MRRRGFLGALLGAAVLDPEKLLWVPGKKLISIPRRGNVLLPWQQYIRYVLVTMQNREMVESYSRAIFGANSPRRLELGDTVQVRRPPRFLPRDWRS